MALIQTSIFVAVFIACSFVAVTTAYGVRNGAASVAGEPISAFASASTSSAGPAGPAIAGGLANAIAGFTRDQIDGQLAKLRTGDMVLINDRRFVAVRGDGQKSVTILVEASDDSYALSANVRDAVSSNINAKSDGYSKTVASALRDFTDRQSIVGADTASSSYSAPSKQSVAVEAAASSGFGLENPAPSKLRQQQASVAAAASRDQHSYSSVSANSRLVPAAKTEEVWDYSESIPGVADKDYPIYAEVPVTSFTCKGRHEGGYYADVETRCQVFHVCALEKKYSFICPNGTVFDQRTFVCNWWSNVDCESSGVFYELNLQIGSTTAPSVSASLSSSSFTPQLAQQAVVAEKPRPTFGLPTIQPSNFLAPPREPVVAQPLQLSVIGQSVTTGQTIKPTYGVPKPQQPLTIQPVVIQQQSAFAQTPQASVAASAY